MLRADKQIDPLARRRSHPAVGNRSLWALYIAVYAYFIVIIIRPQDLIPPIGAVRPGLLTMACVLVAWVICRPKRPLLNDGVFRWQLVFLTVVLVGVFVIVNHRSWLNMTLSYLEYMFVFSIALPTVMQREEYCRGLLHLFLFSFFFVAVWVIVHQGVGTGAWLSDENDAAAFLIVGICLGYALWAESARPFWRRYGALVAGVCIVAVISTNSRGGFIGLVAAIIAMTVFSRAFIRASVIALLGVALSAPLVPDSYKKEILSIEDTQNATRVARLYSWARGWDMFVANPVIGVGAGNYPWTVHEYEQSPEAVKARGSMRSLGGRAAHSLPFTLLSETGALGSLAFVCAIGLVFRRAWLINRANATPGDDSIRRVLAAWVGPAIVGYTAAGVFISVLWYPPLWLLAGLGIGLGSAFTAARPSGKYSPPGSRRKCRQTPSRKRSISYLRNWTAHHTKQVKLWHRQCQENKVRTLVAAGLVDSRAAKIC